MFIGHVLADYPLQGEFIANGKNRNLDHKKLFSEGTAPLFLWVHAMTAHCLIQAGFVWLITGSAVLAIVEFVVHWIIDFVRCEGWISFNVDQGLHFACKVIYAVLLVYQIV